MTPAPSTLITERTRLVIVVMLVASLVVGAGIPMVERSTSLDQFQTDAEEATAKEYVDDNFGATNGTTAAQVIVTDEDVLDRDTLLAMLEYERTLRESDDFAATLVETDPIRSVANLLATTAIRDERMQELQRRQRDLDRTSAALAETRETLVDDPEREIRPAFDAVDSRTPVTLGEAEYERFATSVRSQRAETSQPSNETERQVAEGDRSRAILAAEYESLARERAKVRDLDPTLDAQFEAIQAADDEEIERLSDSVFSGNRSRTDRALALMPEYFEPGSGEANATLLVVRQDSPGDSFAPADAPEEIETAQQAMVDLEPDDESMSILVYGEGIVATEMLDSMTDSVQLVGPLAIAFVLVVLVVVYRDPLDVLLGLAGIAFVLAWTFGVMGWAGITFSQPFIVVLVLLIGLSIDYGLHVVMRSREARPSGDRSPREAMRIALGSVGVALVFVTATTVIGFLSNLTSPLSIFRQLGVVSAIGITSTLLIFGVFVPAVKVELDTRLESRGIDRERPAVGTGGGSVTQLLASGATLATKVPYVVIVVAVLLSGIGGYGATGIDASFTQSDFLAEDPDDRLKELPGPIAPGSYTTTAAIDRLDDDFLRQDTTASVLVTGNVTDPETLERIDAARETAGEMEAVETYANGDPALSDPVTLLEDVAARNESVAASMAAADADGDGLPDENVTAIYDQVVRVAPDAAAEVLHREDGEYGAVRLVATVDGTADGGEVRDQLATVADDVDGGGLSAVATGTVVVNQLTADELAATAVLSLLVALSAVFLVLTAAYRYSAGSAMLGVVTIVPVAMTLTWVLGTMALLDIPFNIVTGMITGLTIGLGVDYSLHVSERFTQEVDDAPDRATALEKTVVGTGGALLSSATTTAAGFAVLLVAILPFLQSFGLITALTIVFAFLSSVFVLPSLLVVWARVVGR